MEREQGYISGQDCHQTVSAIENLLLDILGNLGVDDELMHLLHAASLMLLLMVVGMLVVGVAVFSATLLYEADAIEVMMMEYNGRKQHGACCQP